MSNTIRLLEKSNEELIKRLEEHDEYIELLKSRIYEQNDHNDEVKRINDNIMREQKLHNIKINELEEKQLYKS